MDKKKSDVKKKKGNKKGDCRKPSRPWDTALSLSLPLSACVFECKTLDCTRATRVRACQRERRRRWGEKDTTARAASVTHSDSRIFSKKKKPKGVERLTLWRFFFFHHRYFFHRDKNAFQQQRRCPCSPSLTRSSATLRRQHWRNSNHHCSFTSSSLFLSHKKPFFSSFSHCCCGCFFPLSWMK